MKKWTHLIVFAILSGISTLIRTWGMVTNSLNQSSAQDVTKELEKLGVPNSEDLAKVSQATMEFQNNLINKALIVLLLIAMVAMIVFLIQKKYELSSYTYIGYLFGTLILATYSFIGKKGVAQLYSDETMRQVTEAGALGGYIFSIVLFAIYFGLTVFFMLRKPKETPSMETTSTDI